MNRAPNVSSASIGRLAWPLLFGAVIAQLPALRAWFAQDDWDSLARAVGLLDVGGIPIRPLSTLWTWQLEHALFGLDAVAYHAVALLGFAAMVLLSVRVAARLGAGRTAQAVAGLWTLTTPFALRPISWASATGEIWAAAFALLAIEWWMRPGRPSRPWPLAAAGAGLLSLSAKESGLVLPIAFALATRWWPAGEEGSRIRRARATVIGATALAAAITAILVARHFSAGIGGAYSTGGPVTVLSNLATAGGWMLTPFAGWPLAPSALLRVAGGLGWLLFGFDALRRWREDDHLVAFAWVVAVGALAPTLALEAHFESYYALLSTCAVGWWLGSLAERGFGPRLRDPRLFVVVLVVLVALSALRTHSAISLRDAAGQIHDPILRRSSVALETARQLRSIPDLEQLPMVAVLQATRIPLPEGAELPEGASVIVTTPVHRSLRGELGLQLLLPEGVRGRWVTHLEELPLDTLVLLDTGDDHLRILGPLENARLYSALIAVAAGQFPRARHDLWSVIGKVGTEVRFAYRPENLPITPAELDAEAEPFVRYLEQDREPSSRRVLKLFAQLYEAVRGRPLFDETWLNPERAPRSGD